jgi:hypothetical protein
MPPDQVGEVVAVTGLVGRSAQRGLGDDTYYVDNAKDVVDEDPDEGIDTIISYLPTYVPSLSEVPTTTSSKPSRPLIMGPTGSPLAGGATQAGFCVSGASTVWIENSRSSAGMIPNCQS